MPAISKKQVDIDSRRKTASGRFYEIVKNDPYMSITNALEVISKPALIGWAGKVEREACIEAAAAMFCEQAYSGTPEQYKLDLTARIGKQKASTKLLNAAGEIGTGTHALIEWWSRNVIFHPIQEPRPKVSDKSEWGFMAFEDWSKEHQFRPIKSEQVVFSHKHKFAGTLDIIGWVDDSLTIVDIKTGKAIYAEAKMQVSAYWAALQEMSDVPPHKGIVLRLPKVEEDPEFEAVPIDNLEFHFDAFLHALALRKWQIAMDEEYRAKTKGE